MVRSVQDQLVLQIGLLNLKDISQLMLNHPVLALNAVKTSTIKTLTAYVVIYVKDGFIVPAVDSPCRSSSITPLPLRAGHVTNAPPSLLMNLQSILVKLDGEALMVKTW